MKEIELSGLFFLQTVEETVRRGESILIAGSGDSMRPFITPETDKLLLAPLPDRPLLPGDIVLYRRPNGQAVIHRIYEVRGNRFDTLGDNQLWIERDVPAEALTAYVRQVIRPEGVFDCDRDSARREACREMARRLNPPKERRPAHVIRAVRRRVKKIWNKRKQQ